jgi:hypothetical protein
MSAPAPLQSIEQASSAASLPLRLAQRAFAMWLDIARHESVAAGAFRAARLRRIARRTVSALSADDHARLIRWLAVQLVTSVTGDAVMAALARVDAAIAAAAGTALARAREELHVAASGDAFAA